MDLIETEKLPLILILERTPFGSVKWIPLSFCERKICAPEYGRKNRGGELWGVNPPAGDFLL